jgi:hypothetical protein
VTQVVQVPNPHEIVDAIMPLVGVATMLVLTGFLALGPVGRAIGRVLMHRFGGERDQALPAAERRDLRGLLEEHGGRLEAVQRQVADLAERQDFAERLLAQVRNQPRLPGAGDAAR